MAEQLHRCDKQQMSQKLGVGICGMTLRVTDSKGDQAVQELVAEHAAPRRSCSQTWPQPAYPASKQSRKQVFVQGEKRRGTFSYSRIGVISEVHCSSWDTAHP